VIQTGLANAAALDLATAKISVFAFEQLRAGLRRLNHSRLVLPTSVAELELLGGAADRRLRNQLRTRWLAVQLADWLSAGVEIRAAEGGVPHGWLLLRNQGGTPTQVLTGSFALDTRGLGLNTVVLACFGWWWGEAPYVDSVIGPGCGGCGAVAGGEAEGSAGDFAWRGAASAFGEQIVE
jgi:hypothetical protein